MNIKACMKISNLDSKISTAFLVIRIVVGIAFLFHGWGKIQNPFGWMPEGSPIPGFLQFLAALSEFGGGIALILGCLTRLAAFGMGFTMLVATYMHAMVFGDPFVSKGGGSFELPLMYLTICILFLVAGPGKYSVDQKLFGTK